MKQFFDDIDEQILRFYRNELTNEEEKLLLEWVNKKDENKKYFREQTGIVDLLVKKDTRFDSKKGFAEFLEKTTKPANSKRLKRLWPVAATILLLLGIATIYLLIPDRTNKEKVYTSVDYSTRVLLSDSSLITLRKGAELKVPEKFSKKQRVVKFRGQAYFNIKHDEKSEFKIVIDNITVEVLEPE